MISMVVITIINFVVFIFIFKSITIAILSIPYILVDLLYLYSLDKKVKTTISLPIYIFLSVCLFTTLFFVLSNLSMPLALNLILVFILFISKVIGGFYRLKPPPFVIDGKYCIEDAKKHGIKMLKNWILIMAGLLIFSLILNLIFTLWKNTLI